MAVKCEISSERPLIITSAEEIFRQSKANDTVCLIQEQHRLLNSHGCEVKNSPTFKTSWQRYT